MFFPTSSHELFKSFTEGIDPHNCVATFEDAVKMATKTIPVILEITGDTPNDISFIHLKSDEKWIMISPDEIKQIVANIVPDSKYKLVVAFSNKGKTHHWSWECPIEEIAELSKNIQQAISPLNESTATLPAPLNYHFALADIKPEYRTDLQSHFDLNQDLLKTDGEWAWTKTAAVTVEVIPIGDEGIDAHFGIQDLDRAATDRFECYVSLAKTITGYDIGFQINAGQLGIASNVHYWHYLSNEYKVAKQTFFEIKEATHDFIKQYELEKRSFALLGPELKAILRKIDFPHREGTGVFLVQESFHLPVEGDWRQSLYGNRYPGHAVSNIEHGDFSEKQTYSQEEQREQSVQVENPGSRQTTYRYAMQHPVLKRTAIANFQKWLQQFVHTSVPVSIATKILSSLDDRNIMHFISDMKDNPVATIMRQLA